MTKKIELLIESHDLNADNDGEWTITLKRGGLMSAQTGVLGRIDHALMAAQQLATENDLMEEQNNG